MTDIESNRAAAAAYGESTFNSTAPWPVFLAWWRAARAACRPSDEAVAAAQRWATDNYTEKADDIADGDAMAREILRLARRVLALLNGDCGDAT